MKRYSLPIIAIILVVLYFAPSVFESKERGDLLLTDSSKLKGITVKKGTERIEIVKEDGRWWITKPKRYRADTSKVEDLIAALSETLLENPVTDDPGKYSTYRVDKDADYIELHMGDATKRIYTGKRGPRYSLVYIRPEGDKRVYLVRSRFVDRMPRGVADFRDKTIWAMRADSIKEVQWQKGKKYLHILKKDGRWQRIEKDKKKTSIDEQVVKDYLQGISSLHASGFLPEDRLPDDAIEEGYIKVIEEGREHTLKLYKKKDAEEYYLLKEDIPYRISRYTKDALFKDLKAVHQQGGR